MGNEPRLNIILDSRMPEKYENIIKELSAQNITDYEVWPCLLYPNVVTAINCSHKMIVQDAKEKGLEECCIAEDDLMFPSKNGWRYFLQNKPEDFHIYSAGNYLSFQRPKEHGAMKAECIVGFQLYIIHSSYYDEFLNTPEDKHIDTEQKSDKMYVVYPFAALQRRGYSANNKAICDYNTMLNKEDIYAE